MFIQTETTPNPETLKFIPGCEVVPGQAIEIKSLEEAHISPLAEALFTLESINSVFLGSDFISITKMAKNGWDDIKPSIMSIILDHFTTGLPVLNNENATSNHLHELDLDNEIVKQINELIETRIRPAVAMDGGDITLHSFEDGIVYVHLRGACSGCPSATATLKTGIENLLKHFVPEVIEVRPVPE